MPNTHITRCDDPKYLPFARSRLDALRMAGIEFASQSFDVGGVTVRVSKKGDQEYISVTGLSGFYVLLQYSTPVVTSGNGIRKRWTRALHVKDFRRPLESEVVHDGYTETLYSATDSGVSPHISSIEVVSNTAISGLITLENGRAIGWTSPVDMFIGTANLSNLVTQGFSSLPFGNYSWQTFDSSTTGSRDFIDLKDGSIVARFPYSDTKLATIYTGGILISTIPVNVYNHPYDSEVLTHDSFDWKYISVGGPGKVLCAFNHITSVVGPLETAVISLGETEYAIVPSVEAVNPIAITARDDPAYSFGETMLFPTRGKQYMAASVYGNMHWFNLHGRFRYFVNPAPGYSLPIPQIVIGDRTYITPTKYRDAGADYGVYDVLTATARVELNDPKIGDFNLADVKGVKDDAFWKPKILDGTATATFFAGYS